MRSLAVRNKIRILVNYCCLLRNVPQKWLVIAGFLLLAVILRCSEFCWNISDSSPLKSIVNMTSTRVMLACRLWFVIVNQASCHHNHTSHTNCNGHSPTANGYYHVYNIRGPLCSFCVSSLKTEIFRVIVSLDLCNGPTFSLMQFRRHEMSDMFGYNAMSILEIGC